MYYREDIARKTLEQLERVTDNYSLIIVDNGFGDPDYLKSLEPAYYIKNHSNVGSVRAINQGLEVAEGEYVAVLHPDVLIYDEGWLDHILDFMEERNDIGLVGLAGRHTIKEDGIIDVETTVVNLRGYAPRFRPTWRFTEVVTIDGVGWVMKNIGLRLDQDLGIMHFYDLDLSLQYIQAGYRVYVAAVDIFHFAESSEKSSRALNDYLTMIGGDDDAYFEEVREKFRNKWKNFLPITRGYRDEAYESHRVAGLKGLIEELTEYVRHLEESISRAREDEEARREEISKAARHLDKVERDNTEKDREILRLKRYIERLERERNPR